MKNDFYSISSDALIQQSPGSDKTALVLGGGGARGYTHLGVAQALEEIGVEPDIVVGTSMGAVIGAAVANRANLDGMLKVMKRLDINDILKISRESRRELQKLIGKSLVREIVARRRENNETDETPVKLTRVFTLFKLMTKNSSIEDLKIDYAAIATDLEKGGEVVLKSGKVYRAAAASSAIPGFIPPVKLDGRTLVDGGVVDVLPILPALAMGAERVLAVDVSEKLNQELSSNPLSLFYRTSSIRQKELVNMKISIARRKLGEKLEILRPPVNELNWLDFNEVEKAASLGRSYTRERSSRVEEVLSGVAE
ncbi:patatin-like phospholipase family protein [Candidatus Bipolaricaulota bacterium]|nr:patatin-like phospholipase family protein [Candidatus Bipolaricaulota bacterium]